MVSFSYSLPFTISLSIVQSDLYALMFIKSSAHCSSHVALCSLEYANLSSKLKLSLGVGNQTGKPKNQAKLGQKREKKISRPKTKPSLPKIELDWFGPIPDSCSEKIGLSQT